MSSNSASTTLSLDLSSDETSLGLFQYVARAYNLAQQAGNETPGFINPDVVIGNASDQVAVNVEGQLLGARAAGIEDSVHPSEEEELIEGVRSFAETNEDWDPIPTSVAIHAAQRTYDIKDLITENGLEWVMPHFGSNGMGGISLHWWNGERSLTFHFRVDESTAYVFAWGADMWNEMESDDNPSQDEILSLWRRLYNNE